KLALDYPEKFNQYLESLTGRIEVVVKKFRKSRSDNENRYYWGVVVELLSKELGYEREEMHEALKWQFLRDESRKIPTVRSTADLSTVEFEDYLSRIRRWASIEMEINIPLPN